MIHKHSKTVLSRIALGLALATPLAFTTTTVEAREGRKGGHMMGKFKALNLTEEQKKKMKEIRQNGRKDAEKLREEMKTAKKQLKDAAQKDSSKDELTKLFNVVQEKKNALAKHRFSKALEIREILTPDQRKKAADLMDDFAKERKGRHHKGNHDDEGEE